jgi:poly(A) polymerase
LSPNALRVLYRLKTQGFTAYLVGGCVRDLLLGREPKDFDVATDATPGQVKRLFRNCRLVGRRFRLAHLHFNDEIIEVATFRAEQPEETMEDTVPTQDIVPGRTDQGKGQPPRHLKSEEGVVLRDNVFGAPEQDALRRDFTVNALFYDIATFSIIDYAGGMEDLKRGVIRTIGDPVVRFTEDPVRMLRALRFAAMMGFTIKEDIWEAIVELNGTITRSTPPRLFEELLKLFLCGEGEKCYQLLRRSGLMQSLLPDFSDWLDRETGGFPHARIGKALEWTDERIRKGGQVSQQLLLSLVLGEYLEERRDSLHNSGIPRQQALDMAVAGFIGDLAPTVLIPNRTGLQVREILSSQDRLRKIPGKKPHSFVARHSFSDALAYFSFMNSLTGNDHTACRWWECFINENGLQHHEKPLSKERPESAGSRPRRSRARRGRKKTATPQTP